MVSQEIDEYNNNPNLCKYCDLPLLVTSKNKLRIIKKRKFCSHKCAYNYRKSETENKNKSGLCVKCKEMIIYKKSGKSFSKRKYCEKCLQIVTGKLIQYQTKTDLYNKYNNSFSMKTRITNNARNVFKRYKKKQECHICGYDKHIEIAHIKSVKSFCYNTEIGIINHPDNLIALCPNHHWEYDHEYFSLII